MVGEWGALGILDVWGPDAIFPVRPTVEDSSYFNFIKKFELNSRGLLNFSSKQAHTEERIKMLFWIVIELREFKILKMA